MVGHNHNQDQSTVIPRTNKMLMIHSVFALTVIINNSLYVVRPPNAEKAYVSFDKQLSDNQTRWTLMDHTQLDGINLFKTLLLKNITQESIVTYKIRFYSKGYTQETMWQSSILKEPTISKDIQCNKVFVTIISFVLVLTIFSILLYLLYTKYSCRILNQ